MSPFVVSVALLSAGGVAVAAFVLLRIRRRIHALRLEVTRVATLCGALQTGIDALHTRLDEVTDRSAELEDALFFELYPAEVLPLIDELDRGGRLTEGTAERLRRLTIDIRAEAWSGQGTVAGAVPVSAPGS